jgi:hypothetical protein
MRSPCAWTLWTATALVAAFRLAAGQDATDLSQESIPVNQTRLTLGIAKETLLKMFSRYRVQCIPIPNSDLGGRVLRSVCILD